ncbi:MAG: GNAT family N-acetyltransferase [Deltaproteobacteria bacterium]|jgi:GNAT superfamily N-acetyltransferase|nr:GNAT family N-acetyltransferase [Deltaproteobacteria bacterium]
MIRHCVESDFEAIHEIINDAARAYRGVIPPDRWHEPYMSADELSNEINDGVIFWGAEQGGGLAAVMGIQDRGDVTLIRHAYVRTEIQGQGMGTALLRHLEGMTERPILIGTWADAAWAVSFYRKNGYTLVTKREKDLLLKRYWHIPDRQVETSVVLADAAAIRRLSGAQPATPV